MWKTRSATLGPVGYNMTTIAWDGHSLAADQGMWCNGRISQGSKIEVVTIEQGCLWGLPGDKLIVATMGSAYCNERVRKYLACVEGWDDLNLLDTGHDGGDIVAVIVDKNRHVWDLSPLGHRYRSGCARKNLGYGSPPSYLENLPERHVSYEPDYFSAWGAGGTFAFGVLAAGKDAEAAVDLAIKYTEFAAVGVDVVVWADVFGFGNTQQIAPQNPDDYDIPF